MAMQSDTAVSAADREAAAARLREQYSAGRLTLDEFQERLDAVYRAQTPWDLGRVTTDLPLEGVVYGPGGPEAGGYLAGAADVRAALAQAGRRIALTFGLLMAGGFVVLALLITAFMVHGGLLGLVLAALLAIVAAGAAAVAGLAWMAAGCGGAGPGWKPCRCTRRPALAGPGGPARLHRARPVAAARPTPPQERLTARNGTTRYRNSGPRAVPASVPAPPPATVTRVIRAGLAGLVNSMRTSPGSGGFPPAAGSPAALSADPPPSGNPPSSGGPACRAPSSRAPCWPGRPGSPAAGSRTAGLAAALRPSSR